MAMAEDAVESVHYAVYSDAIATGAAPQEQEHANLNGEVKEEEEEHLYELRGAILRELQPLLEGYVWQQEGFNLEVVGGTGRKGHLAGSTRFGDNIEDEWFIVYLLRLASQSVPGISITVRDTDGEFLLIEAAYVIPRWLKPENSLNRVFLRDGWVHLVRRAGRRAGEKLLGGLTVEEAVGLMRDGGGATRASEEVQEAIARRIKGYPAQARLNMHRTRCVVPVSVAQVLKHEPQLVSLAVDAFYRRDVDAMKAATRLKKFLPGQGGDAGSNSEMVEVLVTMSRAMYAQLHQQMFAAPRKYPMPAIADSKYKPAELGMKLTCGFEMMYWERQRFETDDLLMSDEGGNLRGLEQIPVGDPGWEVYRKSLEKNGYFQDLLEGSREHKQLLQAAILDYRRTGAFAATSAARQTPIKRVKEILALQHTAADFRDSSLPESDSDAWLYDGEGDLTSAIHERQAEIDAHETKRAMRQNADGSAERDNGDSKPGETTDEPLYDPEELVQGIQAFMSKISSYEGAELPGDEAVSINMSRFMKELESALGSNETAETKEDALYDSDWETESGTCYLFLLEDGEETV
ncbi:hypothetical protein M758_1G320500 [Ceratodon purpureus]|nr:hypothetical protein M758_1G320500 [Ceratodon purpureus]